MTKRNGTKRALLSSVVALFLCFSMLLGTTFAWFTDSVTSSGNIIKSGTLDVTMKWADGTKAVPADDSTDWKDASTGAIFDYDLWEPGYTEVRHIKIANEGTLALKYQLNIIANGEVSELADVIDVYYVDPAVQVADRTVLTDDNKLGTLTEVLANISTTASGNLLAGEAHTVTLALKMQESAGNKYQDLSIGSNFSVQLMATQFTYESDSFDNMYDDIQPIAVNTYEDFVAALGDESILYIDLTDAIVVPENTTVVVNGVNMVSSKAGHDVKFGTGVVLEGEGNIALNGVDIVFAEYEHNLIVDGNITISGNGTDTLVWDQLSVIKGEGSLTLKDVNTYNDDEFYVEVSNLVYERGTHIYGALLLQESPVVTFKDGYMTFESTKGWHTYAPDIIIGGNATLNIEGGEIVYDYNGDQAMTLGGYYYIPVKNVTVNITGGKIDAGPECLISVEKGENTASNTKVNISGGTFILNNGRVLQDFSSWGDAENYGEGMLTLTGGTFFTSNSTRLDSFVTDGYELVGDATNGYIVSAK